MNNVTFINIDSKLYKNIFSLNFETNHLLWIWHYCMVDKVRSVIRMEVPELEKALLCY